MIKQFLLWLWLIGLVGCNIRPVALPDATSTPMTPRPVSPTLKSTFTPIPTFIPAAPSETLLIPATLLPSATYSQPDPVTPATQQAETPEKDSQHGSVVLQGGLCCIGGVVGTKVELRIDFIAPSSFGPVIEMRRMEGMFCFSEGELANAPWEPFANSVTETYRISAINWLGHYISVQYRDNLGNISPVVCDDISVEGMPAPPTPGS